jgi:hypothetical protein
MPQAVAMKKRNLLFVLFLIANNCVYAQNYVTTVAGRHPISPVHYDSCGFYGDGGPAASALMDYPAGLCRDKQGNLYVAAIGNNRIRKVNLGSGIITTIAGGGSDTGNNIPATNALLTGNVAGVCTDKSGNLLFSVGGRNAIYRLNMLTGIMTRVVGTGAPGFSGDGGPATAASLKNPLDVCIDTSGNIYIADGSNSVIRKVDVGTGLISTIAGMVGMSGSTGDSGPATNAQIAVPVGVYADAMKNIFITGGAFGHWVRKVEAGTGIITRIAGTGVAGDSGDGGSATAAKINYPRRVVMDDSGNLYIAQSSMGRIRKVNMATGIITSFAGNGGVGGGTSGYGDDGPADSASFSPLGMAFDTCGNLFFVDNGSCRVRVVTKALPLSLSCGTSSTVNPYSIHESLTWNVYPNPATNTLTISGPESSGEYRVNDVLGRIVLQGALKNNETKIDISNLVPGSYVITTGSYHAIFVKE